MKPAHTIAALVFCLIWNAEKCEGEIRIRGSIGTAEVNLQVDLNDGRNEILDNGQQKQQRQRRNSRMKRNLVLESGSTEKVIVKVGFLLFISNVLRIFCLIFSTVGRSAKSARNDRLHRRGNGIRSINKIPRKKCQAPRFSSLFLSLVVTCIALKSQQKESCEI